jgi:hypothetical protein
MRVHNNVPTSEKYFAAIRVPHRITMRSYDELRGDWQFHFSCGPFMMEQSLQ